MPSKYQEYRQICARAQASTAVRHDIHKCGQHSISAVSVNER